MPNTTQHNSVQQPQSNYAHKRANTYQDDGLFHPYSSLYTMLLHANPNYGKRQPTKQTPQELAHYADSSMTACASSVQAVGQIMLNVDYSEIETHTLHADLEGIE